MIPLQCGNCGAKYRAADRHAGRRLHCKICGQSLRVPEPLDASAEGLEQVIRHVLRTEPPPSAIADPACTEAVIRHIETHLGPATSLPPESASGLANIDVQLVHPTDERPFYTLVTCGMSCLPMTVPDEAEECSRFAELMLCLPADWDMSEEALADPRWNWPLRWLNMLARLPHEYDTWLGFGHTMPNGNPPAPFAANTKLCCWMLLTPRTVSEDFRLLKIGRDRTVEFFGIVPIYLEEMQFKLKHHAEPLANRLHEFEITELLEIERPNVCRRG